MKWIKRIFIGLVTIFLLTTIVSLFLPSHVLVERSIVIKAPAENIFEQIVNLKNWDRWQVWNQMDPNWKVQYAGPDQGVNSSHSWQSTHKQVGNGKATITAVVPFDSVIVKLDFLDYGQTSYSKYFFKKEEGGIRVTTTMDMDMSGFPLYRIMGQLMKSELIANFDKGLEQLKGICEKDPIDAAKGNFFCKESYQNEQPYYSITDTVMMSDDLTKVYGQMYGEIGVAIASTGLKMVGPVFAIYHYQDSAKMVVEWAVPTDKAGAGQGNVKAGVLKASKIVYCNYYGKYEEGQQGTNALTAFAKTKNLTLSELSREIYITAPVSSDMSQVLTIMVADVK
ncbi:MAG: SRPBCC family protein [Bacteroidia bacterium]